MRLFTYPELLREIERVKILLVTNKKQFTIRQNRKYLAKLEKVPVLMADNLSEEQVKKLRVIDNKTNESEWDFDLLKQDIGDLDFSGFEIDWEIPELDEEEKEVSEDEFDVDKNIPQEPMSKLGDIYQLGNHRLMCGDSTSEEDVKKLMGGLMLI